MTGIQFITDEAGQKTAVVIESIRPSGKTLRMCWSPDRAGMKSASRSPR